jgi:iron complex outermembrane receptor protein
VTQCTLADALAGVAGLVVQPGFGDIDPPRISARGSGLQSAPMNRGLLVRLGELPLNAADGTFNTALIESAFFEGVQFRGAADDSAAAALAPGGSLDFLGYAPARLAAAVGSDGLRKFVAQGAAQEFQLPDYRRAYQAAGAGATMQSDGWRPQSAQQRTAAITQTAWAKSEELVLRASLYGADLSYDVPGPLTLAQAETDPDSVSAMAAADRPRRETRFGRFAFAGDWRGSGRDLNGAFSVQRTDDRFRQLRGNGIADTSGTDCALQLSGRTRFFSVGALWLGTWREQQRFTNLAGATGSRFADLRQQAHSVTGWADGSWRVASGLDLDVGVSWLLARRAVAGTTTADSDYAAIVPHLALKWRPRWNWELFARAERGAEPPTFDDLLATRGPPTALSLVWTPLRRQRADTVEVGVRYAAWNRCSFGVTAYVADWHDELLRLADADGAARGTVNAGPTRHRGIESSLRWALWRGRSRLDFRLAHNWSEARFADDPIYGHNRLAGLPEHVGAAELEWSHERGPFAALGASWVWGRTFADHANLLSFPGHTLANARLGWRNRRWSAALEVGNVFDRGYIASTAGVLDRARDPAGTAVFLPGRPRTFTVSFERRW